MTAFASETSLNLYCQTVQRHISDDCNILILFTLIGSNGGRNVVTYDSHNLYCNEHCLVPCLFSSMKDTKSQTK
jgi:hypothetical protein